jgi:hypothetical protein
MKTASYLMLLFSSTALVVGSQAPDPSSSQPVHHPAYHESAPTAPLPLTLNPAQFEYNRTAFVAYAVAGRVRETLYQEPCYCHCDREAGHTSLLDCFTGKHGAMCSVCQREAIFCYLERQKGKTPAEIRDALAKGDAMRMPLETTVNRLYRRIGGTDEESSSGLHRR